MKPPIYTDYLCWEESNDVDLDGRGSHGCELLLHVADDAQVHGGAPKYVGVQVLLDDHISLHYCVESGLVDATAFHSKEGGLEECLGGSESACCQW